MSELEQITYEMHDKIAEENCCAPLEMDEVENWEMEPYWEREAEMHAMMNGLDVDYKSYSE